MIEFKSIVLSDYYFPYRRDVDKVFLKNKNATEETSFRWRLYFRDNP